MAIFSAKPWIMRSFAHSYNDYIRSSKLNGTPASYPDVEEMISRIKSNVGIASKFAPVVFLSDYTTGKYIYVDELCFSVLGLTANYFIESGVESYVSRWHPDDFAIFNAQIFAYNLNFLSKLPFEKYQDIIFSCNYRMLNGDGQYQTMLQRFSFIPGHTLGKPFGIIGMIIDITHFKNDDMVIHTIEEVRMQNGIQKVLLLYKRNYFPNDKMYRLSKREIEILQLIGKGLSSKQIAGHLALSIHTINNHRKNMLAKTHTANSSDLVKHALKHGLI
jgi:DNA-binding CsgD family transcriptional regulator